MNKTKKNGITALSIVIAITIILGSLNFLDQKKMFSSENRKTDIMKTFSTNKNGYIAKIHINGVIQEANRTYSQKWLVETIKKLKEDKNNKAIALYIDSPGGALYETDEVYLLLQDYKMARKTNMVEVHCFMIFSVSCKRNVLNMYCLKMLKV